jgi:hypothetical protein
MHGHGDPWLPYRGIFSLGFKECNPRILQNYGQGVRMTHRDPKEDSRRTILLLIALVDSTMVACNGSGTGTGLGNGGTISGATTSGGGVTTTGVGNGGTTAKGGAGPAVAARVVETAGRHRMLDAEGPAAAAPTVTATTGAVGSVSYSASTQRFTVPETSV